MKKIILALIFTIFSVFFGISGCAAPTESVQTEPDRTLKPQPIEEGVDRQSATAAHNYLYSCFSPDENGLPIFPDTFGGNYFPDGNKQLVIQLTTSDPSEYLFIQEEFPCVVFEQVKYSYNYLDELIYEYLSTYDPESETVYSGHVSPNLNKAIIWVDEETLSHKTNDPESPIVFEWGFLTATSKDYNDPFDDSDFIPYGINSPAKPLSAE